MQIPQDIPRADWQVVSLFMETGNKKEVASMLRISLRRVQQITKKHKDRLATLKAQ